MLQCKACSGQLDGGSESMWDIDVYRKLIKLATRSSYIRSATHSTCPGPHTPGHLSQGGPLDGNARRRRTVAFSKRGGVAPREISLSLSCDRAIRKIACDPMVRDSLAKRLLSCLVARLVDMLERKPDHMYLSIRFNHPGKSCSRNMDSFNG